MKKQLALIFIAPLILTLGWPPLQMGFLLFIGMTPLLILEQESKKWFGIKLYFSLLLWNIGTTWWVWNASPEGCIAMLIANSLLMVIPFVFYRSIKKRLGLNMGLAAWIITWLSMEYLHLNWEIAYPWLNLGNGLADLPRIIQWYEYTGTLGGTLWIFIANSFIFKFYLNRSNVNRLRLAFILVLPIAVSLIIWVTPIKNSLPEKEVVVIQPNVDPYLKFETENAPAEVDLFIKMAESKVDSNTEFVLFPETGFTQTCDESSINQSQTYILLTQWMAKYPNLTLVSGSNTYRFFDIQHKTSTARKYGEDKFYDIYNSSIVMDYKGVRDIYRKSKLVPGVEKMPYTNLLSFMEDYAIDLGGISGSLGQDTVARVFYSKSKVGAAPLICYESIFGEYASEFVKNGANVIFILTNDGWWGNTPGYRHHKLYARLRAIETRRDVVRCTNTGISCIIDKKGTISGETPWWKAVSSKYTISPSNQITFYTQYGDYLGIIAAWLFSIVFLMSIVPKGVFKKIFN